MPARGPRTLWCLAHVAAFATAQVQCPDASWTAPSVYVGKCYKVLTGAKTWQQAETACAATPGGHLASITTQSEGQVVMDQYCGTFAAKTFWIGYRINSGSTAWTDRTKWGWSNGAPTTFLHSSAGATWLGTGEPDDAGCGIGHAGDDGVAYGKIGDYTCTSTYATACCEVPSLPTPTATASSTGTSSATATRSVTATGTATSTTSASSSDTATSTPSSTDTRTASGSGTSTATVTNSGTQTPSASDTATSSASASGSVSSTSSSSASISASASLTGSASSTETGTSSGTSTPSATESGSSTASSSVTPSANATSSVSPSLTSSASRSPLRLGIDAINAAGADANATLLVAGAEAGSVPVGVAAGAGAGGLIALLALLCCLWWFLCLAPRKRKAQEEAKARAKRAIARLPRASAAPPSGGTAAPDAAPPSAAVVSVLAPLAAGGAPSYVNMNPALLRAKRATMATPAPPGIAQPPRPSMAPPGSAVPRSARLSSTLAVAGYKKPVAAFKPTAAGASAAGAAAAAQRRQSVALLGAEAVSLVVDDSVLRSACEDPAPPQDSAAAAAAAAQPAQRGPRASVAVKPAGAAVPHMMPEEAGAYAAPAATVALLSPAGLAASAAAAATDEDAASDDAWGPDHDDGDSAPAEEDDAIGIDDSVCSEPEDDAWDEDEPIAAMAPRAVASRAVKPAGRSSVKHKRVAEAAAAPAPPDPRKLVIGTGSLITEKVETQTVRLRRVSKIRGDETLTQMRRNAAERIARPSAAASFGPTAPGMTPYAFVATVARLKIKADTARAAVERRAAEALDGGAGPAGV